MRRSIMLGVAVIASGALGVAAGLASAVADEQSPLADAAEVQRLANVETGQMDPIPDEKMEALLSPSDEADEIVDANMHVVTLVSFGDSGSKKDVAHLRKVAPLILEDLVAVGRVDAGTDAVHQEGSAVRKVRAAKKNRELNLTRQKRVERKNRLDGLVSKAEAAGQLESIEQGLAEVTTEPEMSHLAYVSNKFRVDQFDGVEVDGSTARVALRGAQMYRMLDGHVETDRQLQYDMILQRDKDAKYGWILVSHTSIFVEEAGR